MSTAAASAGVGGGATICFNPHCKEPRSDPPRRKGWRLRSGDYADLCDRCHYSYEQGSFCETYHSDIAGWRNCEVCSKRLHCGCVVSASSFLLRDAGGIECIQCAKKAFPVVPDRSKEFSVRNWNHMGPTLSGHWRQSPLMWNGNAQTDLQQRLSYELDRPNNTRRLIAGRRYTISVQEKKNDELPTRLASSSITHVLPDRYSNGTKSLDTISTLNAFQRECGAGNVQDPSPIKGENDVFNTRRMTSDPCVTSSSGIEYSPHKISYLNSQPSVAVKDDTPLLIGSVAPFSSSVDVKDSARMTTLDPKQEPGSTSLVKQFYPNPQNAVEYSEMQAQVRGGRPRLDAQARSQLLPRYWPRITEQELQQISGDSNGVITPLFEKVLSASDAGRIGRLVLPKKCAEAYFPPISQPEGLPLKVQDAKGKEWTFQFRFWPNNNSRMYVLEGVTPCIQSMQLQAGDTVTFSRIDPEGKLVMGFRKVSNVTTEQDIQMVKDGNGVSSSPDANNKNPPGEFIGSILLRHPKGSTESKSQPSTEEQGARFTEKDGPDGKSPTGPARRKASTLGSKSKRLRMNKDEAFQLKLTWEEAQELLRPPPDNTPNVVVVDGHEIEEYEEAPVLGKPTICTTNDAGGKSQWAQCEDCLKWRKIPMDALLPFRWTCADNASDPERSSCSSAQEVATEQLIPPTKAGSSKKAMAKVESESIELSDGLDTLANLAILGEREFLPSSSQQTTRHPRHRPGCTCIVCIQPPSGKGPKHKQSCTCNVCLTVRRRFRTLMLRREKRQSEKEADKAENSRKQQELAQQSPVQGDDTVVPTDQDSSDSQKQAPVENGTIDDETEKKKQLPSPLKTQIDLNMQPEREDEQSPLSAGSLMKLLRDGC